MIPIGRDELNKALDELKEELKGYIAEQIKLLRKELTEEEKKDAGKHKRTGS